MLSGVYAGVIVEFCRPRRSWTLHGLCLGTLVRSRRDGGFGRKKATWGERGGCCVPIAGGLSYVLLDCVFVCSSLLPNEVFGPH